MECAICLQHCVHPVQLPCSHIFCYLCVKGVANQSKRCAMCRQEIPYDYLDNPRLLSNNENEKSCAFEDGYQWFYEGRNGWWLYDERTNAELEAMYKSDKKECALLIAGFLYTIDFVNMVQMRRNDPSRRRKIKRDLASVPNKGVAGLRIEMNFKNISSNNHNESEENREGAYGESQVLCNSSTAEDHNLMVNAGKAQEESTESHLVEEVANVTDEGSLNETQEYDVDEYNHSDENVDETQEYDIATSSRSSLISDSFHDLSAQSTRSLLRLSISDENLASRVEENSVDNSLSLLPSFSDTELLRIQLQKR